MRVDRELRGVRSWTHAGWVSGTAIAACGLGMATAWASPVAGAANEACPEAFETITLEEAAAQGYVVAPTAVDQNGNGDGTVCRHPLGDGILHQFPNVPAGTQIYIWLDNGTPRG